LGHHEFVTTEREYELLAHEALRSHLVDLGFEPRLDDRGVSIGVGEIVVSFEVVSIDPHDVEVRVVFWCHIDGVNGVQPPRISLDLVGGGRDSAEALLNGMHFVLDGVIPVLWHDHDRGAPLEKGQVATYTSVTEGRTTVWDLILGPPAFGGEAQDAARDANKSFMLGQGIVDSLVDASASARPHWFKLFLIHATGHDLIGDVKVDGVQIGVAPSFASATWPTGTVLVRQFGLMRPTDRTPSDDTVRKIRELEAPNDRRPWWKRLVGSS